MTSRIFIITIYILLIQSSNISNAQYAYWGFKGGYQSNKITGASQFDSKMCSGFNVGVFGNFILSEKWAIQHEAQYSLKGFAGTTIDSFEIKGNLPYFELPWMVQYNISKAFYIHAGLQPSLYLFLKKAKPDSTDYSRYNVNPIDFSGLLGLGAITNNNFLFGVRVNVSLNQTFNTNAFGGRNVALQAYLAYAVNRKVKKKRKK
jgi:hypothetical protein